MDEQKENNTRGTFGERHPKITATIGLLTIMFLAVVAFLFLEIVIKWVLGFVSWLSALSSKIDAVILVALITGLASIVSSIVAKSLEYKRIRREYLTQKREQPYGDFVRMMYKVQQSSKEGHEYPVEQMQEDLLEFSKQITLWGSPKVVKQWGKFKENALDKEGGFKNLILTEDMMNAMRDDLGTHKVKRGELLIFTVNDIKNALKNKKI